MTEPSTNGDAKAAVFRLLDADPSMTRQQLSDALGGTPGARQCGNLARAWRAARQPQDASPGSGAPAATELPAGPYSGTGPAIPATSGQPATSPRVSREEVPARPLTTRTTPARKRARPPAGEQGSDDHLEKAARLVVAWGVAAIALVVSYSHVRSLAIRAGVAWPELLPLIVDGLMLAGWLCLRRHPRYLLARLAVALGVVGSAALNACAARPELVPMSDVRLGAAIAVPVSAVVSMHLALRR